MTVLHRNLTGAELHEPKGISTASAGQLYIANGNGSGVWDVIETVNPEDIDIPVGVTGFYGGTEPPPGWFLCYGQEVSREIYANLFSVLGTTFGVGNGSTTFNLPDCRGRTIEGKEDSTGIGDTSGAQNHTITTGQTPALSGTTNTAQDHTHDVSPTSSMISSGSSFDIFPPGNTSNVSYGSAGSHFHDLTVNASTLMLPHNNIQPSIILNVIIWHGVL